MLTVTRYENLPADHPCAGCEIRMRTFCSVLDARELEQFRCQGSTSRLEPGRPLFHQGDPADVIFNLTKGSLRLYKLLADGRRQVTGFLYPGDFLGISVDDEHAFSAEALEESQLCWFPRARFDDFVDDHSAMERELYRMAAHELAAAQQQFVLLGRKTATERLASFLVLLFERTERPMAGVSGMLRLPMSRSDIADYLGLTKETVSRVISALKRERVIRLESLDLVQILDRDRLDQLSEAAA